MSFSSGHKPLPTPFQTMQNQAQDPAQPLTLVLAATGKTGLRVANRLEARGIPTRRASRSSATRFDWEDESTWSAALEGVHAAYVVFTPDLAVPAAPPAIERFCRVAREAGVRRLVLLSGRGEAAAQRCEEIVRTSGLEWTVVRASWFMQNFSEGPFLDLVLSGTVALPVDAVREPFIDVDDIADVVTEALVDPRHAGRVYEVTGPRSITFGEAVSKLAEATGRPIDFVSITPEEFSAGLAEAGLPEDYVWLLMFLFTEVLDGRNEPTARGVQEALGREPREFSLFARDAAEAGAWSPVRQNA